MDPIMDRRDHETGFNAALTSFVLIGILLIWSGLNGIVGGSPEHGFNQYSISKGILALFLIPLSFICFRKGQTLACAISLTVAVFSITYIPSGLVSGPGLTAAADIPFGIAMLVLAASVLAAGRRMAGIAAALMGAALMSEGLSAPDIVSDSMMAASGAVFLSIGLIGFASLRRIGPGTIDAPSEKAEWAIPMMLLVGIHGLIAAISPSGPALYIDTAVLSLAVIAVSFGALNSGMLLIGTSAMMYGACNITDFIPSAMGAGSFGTGSAVFCIPILICGSMLVRKNRLVGTMFASFALMMMLSAVAGSDTVRTASYAVIGIGGMAASLLLMSGKMKTDDSAKVIPELIPSSQVPTAGGFSIACMLLLAFVVLEHSVVEPMTDDSAVDAMMLASSVLVVAMSVAAIRSRMITESVILMLSGTSFMILTVADITLMSRGLTLMSAFIAAGLAVGMFIFLRRREYCRGIATGMTAASIIALTNGMIDASALTCLIAGNLFLASSVRKTAVFSVIGGVNTPEMRGLAQTDMQYTTVLMKTLGILMVALLCMMNDVNIIGRDQFEGMEVTRMILCLVLTGMGTYMISKGLGPAGALMFITSAIGLISSVMAMLGYGVPGAFPQLMALSLVPVFYSAFVNGDRITFMITFIVFLTLTVGSLPESGHLLNIMDMILRIVSCATAMILWIQHDTGREFMNDLLERLSRKGKVRRVVAPDDLRGVWSMGIMMSAVACIWAGASLIYTDIQGPSAAIPLIMLSMMVVLFALCMMCKGMMTDGSCVLSAGAMLLALPFGHMDADAPACAAMLCSMLYAASERRYSMAMMMLVCLASRCTIIADLPEIGGALLIAAGLVMLPYAAAKFSGHLTRPAPGGTVGNVSMMLTAAVGTTYILSLLNPGSMVSGLTVSAVASALSVAMVIRGMETHALYLLSLSVPCIGYCILSLSGLVENTTPMLIMCMSSIVAGCAFIREREYMLCASCAICTSMMMLHILSGDQVPCAVGGMAFAVITAVYVLMRVRDDRPLADVA